VQQRTTGQFHAGTYRRVGQRNRINRQYQLIRQRLGVKVSLQQ
jgi:hypothetical protein